MTTEKKPNWLICIENQQKVDEYDFSHLKDAIIPIKPCTCCNGSGYTRQKPGHYGLSHCIICGGSGKMIGTVYKAGE